jgi:hypothetical protein
MQRQRLDQPPDRGGIVVLSKLPNSTRAARTLLVSLVLARRFMYIHNGICKRDS